MGEARYVCREAEVGGGGGLITRHHLQGQAEGGGEACPLVGGRRKMFFILIGWLVGFCTLDWLIEKNWLPPEGVLF